MLPLNYAILSYFCTVDEADATAVMNALRPTYGNFRTFKKPAILEALMAAEANGLLEESRLDLDGNNQLQVYYRLNDYGRSLVKTFIGAQSPRQTAEKGNLS